MCSARVSGAFDRRYPTAGMVYSKIHKMKQQLNHDLSGHWVARAVMV
jgi:hypothetical protein